MIVRIYNITNVLTKRKDLGINLIIYSIRAVPLSKNRLMRVMERFLKIIEGKKKI